MQAMLYQWVVADLYLGSAQCRQFFTNGWGWFGGTYVWGLHSADNALPMGRWPTYVWRLHSAVNALPVGGGGWVGGATYVWGLHNAGNALQMGGGGGGGATYV